ncbi:hypothetical protein [Paenibacillus lautus]|uniref:hypothetical protein n=1 Tax=Paenibacillus lautus TaxID=1401 RepID=UPI001C0F50BC|nr:hypothetical protein [Paenibacillus lautus]MBU5349153.1 hypothetical protein [Paenibacillus lautus]
MRKKLLALCCAAAFFTISLPINFVNADSNSGLTLVQTKSYELNGEQFEVETWRDVYGNEIHSIPTNVENKSEVSEYVKNLISDENEANKISYEDEVFTPLANTELFAWTKPYLSAVDHVNNNARVELRTSGYNEYNHPGDIVNTMAVNNGTMRGEWLGAGTADKIVLRYSYEFTGGTITISYPPSLQKSGTTVSWSSDPVPNVWFLNTSTEAARANSILFSGLNIKAASDIYKGSNIYKPTITEKINFPKE